MGELQTKPSKRRNKRRGEQSPLAIHDSTEWERVTPKTRWSSLKSELKAYWDFDLEAESIDTGVEKYMFQKVSILRAFCQRTGVQVFSVLPLSKTRDESLVFIVDLISVQFELKSNSIFQIVIENRNHFFFNEKLIFDS